MNNPEYDGEETLYEMSLGFVGRICPVCKLEEMKDGEDHCELCASVFNSHNGGAMVPK